MLLGMPSVIDPTRQRLSHTDEKALRLVREGRVHVTWTTSDGIAGAGIVDGDTDTYLCSYSPAGRICTCLAGSGHRDCSHAKALELKVLTEGVLALEFELGFA